MVMMHVRCYGLREHPEEIAGKSYVRPLFLPVCFSVQSVLLKTMVRVRFSGIFGSVGLDAWAHLMISWLLKFSMLVGGLPTGSLVLEAPVHFIAVFEHRLIPARVRGEWARLRAKGCASVSAPAFQESFHVGHAGVGVVSMKGAPLSLPTPATAQFKRFFDCGSDAALHATCCFWPVPEFGWFCMGIRVLRMMLSSLL